MTETAEVSAGSSSPRYARSPNRMERAALFRADGLPPVNRAAAVEAVRDFVAALDASDFGHYSDVLVYGSRVRDDWDEYSDIDVAVVVPGMLSGGDLFMRLEELTVKTLDVRWAHWRLSTVVVSEGALAFPHAVKGNSEFYRSLRAEGVSWGSFVTTDATAEWHLERAYRRLRAGQDLLKSGHVEDAYSRLYYVSRLVGLRCMSLA